MGSIKQLKNGMFFASVYDSSGKRQRRRFGLHKNAKAFISRIENDKSDDRLNSVGLKKRRTTISLAIEDFMNTKSGLKKKSIAKYERAYDQFLVFCNNRNIKHMGKFSRDAADAYWSLLQASGAAAKTMNFYLMVVKTLFVYEVGRDRLSKSPFTHIKGEKEKVKSMIERDDEYYDKNEINAFFNASMTDDLRHLFSILFLTGFRISELQSLTWERSIDLQNKLIKLRKYDGYDTKTDSSERDIPMTDLVYNIITEMKGSNSKGYLFKNQSGGQASERTLLTKCKSIAKKAGITKNATLRMWRDSFASHTMDAGILYEERQYLMGHKPESMTDRYTKVDPSSLQEKLSKLDELIK